MSLLGEVQRFFILGVLQMVVQVEELGHSRRDAEILGVIEPVVEEHRVELLPQRGDVPVQEMTHDNGLDQRRREIRNQ